LAKNRSREKFCFAATRKHEHYSDDQDEIKWTKDFLAKLEWKLFEDICVEYLRSKHCNANVTCTGADGGVDIKVQDPAGRVIAIGQCKAWNKPIGVSLIRELYGIMAAERIKHGIFLTSSFFSKDAKQFAKDKDLLLIDGVELAALISQLDADEKACIQARVVKADYSTHNLCTL
jgi:restriction system protein